MLLVHSLTKDNKVSIEFFANFFHVKDLAIREILCNKENRDGVYFIQLSSSLSSQIYPLASLALSTWHQRLGHANLRIVRSALSTNNISFSSPNVSSLCHDCSTNKIPKLPFSNSQFVANKPCKLL